MYSKIIMKKIFYVLMLVSCLPLVVLGQNNQETVPQRANAIVIGNDTFPYQYLQEVQIFGDYSNANLSKELERIRYNVNIIFPYALQAAKILQEVDDNVAVNDKKRDQKKYIRSVEDELNDAFKDKLKNLSTNQGIMLVKLINRQTGKDCYSIIKNLKGGFSARIGQTAASLWGNDLKTQYDPYGKDKDIERFVQEYERSYAKYINQYKLKTRK